MSRFWYAISVALGLSAAAWPTSSPAQDMRMRPLTRPDTVGPAQAAASQAPAMQPTYVNACMDEIARKAAFWTYLKTRLNLDVQQLETWGDIDAALRANEHDERELCLSARAEPGRLVVLQRAEALQRALATQLVRLERLTPSIQKLAETLSPEQELIFLELMPIPL